MADVSFNEEPQYAFRTLAGTPSTSSGLFALVQKWGLAKDAQEAKTVLLVLTAVFVLIAIGVGVFALMPRHIPNRPVGPPVLGPLPQS